MNESDARVGMPVKFRCQWPFMVRNGTILRIETRPREFGNGTETGAFIEWTPDYLEPNGGTTFVPFWNARLSQ